MNQTRLYRFCLLLPLLTLVGCTVYQSPRYSDNGVYYDDGPYYSDVRYSPSRAYGAGTASVYSAFPVHYPYWSLDYFYFSQFYHPYSVFVGYYEPFYHPYPGWHYGYRPYRPGLAINIGFSNYPWHWHGHRYRPSHYGWFGSAYYSRGYRHGYRRGYRHGHYDDYDHRANRVSERMRRVQTRDLAYSRASVINRTARTGSTGSRYGNDRYTNRRDALVNNRLVNSTTSRQRALSGSNRSIDSSANRTISRSDTGNDNVRSRDSLRNQQTRSRNTAARGQPARNSSNRNPATRSSRPPQRTQPSTRPNRPQRLSDTRQQGTPVENVRGRVINRAPPNTRTRANRTEGFDVRSRHRVENAPRVRQPQNRVRPATPRSAAATRTPAPQSSVPRQRIRSQQSAPAQQRQAPRQQPRRESAPRQQAPRQRQSTPPPRPARQQSAPAAQPSRAPRSERPARNRSNERRRSRDSDG